MKNHDLYVENALIDYVGSLWTTDEFRNAHKTLNQNIWQIIIKACRYPICFYEPSDPIERSHFSTLWRCIPIRHYNNPAVNDLYYLHELTHLATMEYARECDQPYDFYDWEIEMEECEILASLVSEVHVYLWFPSLRKKTFDFEIWADRFINQGAQLTIEWITKITQERCRAMCIPHENDPIEDYIKKYSIQNMKWTEIWKNSFYKVNQNINKFEKEILKTEKTTNEEFYKSLSILMDFIDDNTTDGVPFKKEAQDFHNYLDGSVKTMFTT